MAHDPISLIAVLEAELQFLETGRYRGSAEASWKAASLFLDSPSCLNFKLPHRPYPCSECSLIDFVPPASLEEGVPCHFIRLNSQGETINSLERQAHQSEMEEAVKQWLRATIARLRSTLSSPPSTHLPQGPPLV